MSFKIRPNRLSHKFRVGLFYFLITSTLLPVIYLLNRTSADGASAQLALAESLIASACDQVQSSFARGITNRTFEKADEVKFQTALLEIVLERFNGIEGGFWNQAQGFQSYAFPTYDGAGQKKDVPRSEMPALAALARSAIQTNRSQQNLHKGKREAVYTYACAINTEPRLPTAAWVLMRVPLISGAEFDSLQNIIVILFILMVLTGIGSIYLLYCWTRDLRHLQRSIETHSVEDLSDLEANRDRDLQKIVHAFNDLNRRLQRSRSDAFEASEKLRQSDRLALLGRMAAGIAHEIRNPLAAIKLRLENAEVSPAERLPKAMTVVRTQIERVDRLVQMMLAFSQPFALQIAQVNISSLFQNELNPARERARAKGVQIELFKPDLSWPLDRFHFGRALENLIDNAIAYTPLDGRISISTSRANDELRIDVKDSGPGISEQQRGDLFTPFRSNRANGIGLGLVLTKEIIEAHGGRIDEVGDATGACFRIEVPWQTS